jgi:hypothetical protein
MLPMQSVDLAIDEMRYTLEALGMRGAGQGRDGVLRAADWPPPDVRC